MMLWAKIFFFFLLSSLSILFFVVGYQFRRGKWLKLLAGNWEQDMPSDKAEKVGKATGIIMYICTIYFIALSIWIVI